MSSCPAARRKKLFGMIQLSSGRVALHEGLSKRLPEVCQRITSVDATELEVVLKTPVFVG